jgi:hypothetical protein
MKDRDFVLGMHPETEDSLIHDHLGLVHDLVIPDPTEIMLKNLADKHQLDRTDPKVASVLTQIGNLKREHPDNPSVELRAHHHIQTLLVSQK